VESPILPPLAATLEESPPAVPAPEAPRVVEFPALLVAPAPPAAGPAQPAKIAPRRAPTPRPGLSASQKAIIGAAAIALLVVAGAIALQIAGSRSAPLSSAQASALVVSSEARLLSAADLGARPILTLRRGDRVNVLRAPDSRQQEWVEVQRVAAGRASRPGYLKSSEVGDWQSENPEVAIRLLKLFAPGPGAGEAEIRRHLEKMTAFLGLHAISPQGPEANLETANLNVALARLAKNQGQGGAEWQHYIDAAAGQLANAATDGALSARAEQTRRDLQSLRDAAQPATPAVAPPRPAPPEVALRRAEEAWRNGRYGDAARILNGLLAARPGYTPAIAMREKVRRAQQLEAKAR